MNNRSEPPLPPSSPCLRQWLQVAAMLVAVLLGASIGWVFGRNAWGEASETTLQKHSTQLKVLFAELKILRETIGALNNSQQERPTVTSPSSSISEPDPPPPTPEPPPISRAEPEKKLIIRRRSQPAAPTPHPETVARATEEPIAPAKSINPQPEAALPAPQQEEQETPEAPAQPSPVVARPQGAAPDTQSPPASEDDPPPNPGKPPGNRDDAGAQQGFQMEA